MTRTHMGPETVSETPEYQTLVSSNTSCHKKENNNQLINIISYIKLHLLKTNILLIIFFIWKW